MERSAPENPGVARATNIYIYIYVRIYMYPQREGDKIATDAYSAALFTRLARSAPENPGVAIYTDIHIYI